MSSLVFSTRVVIVMVALQYLLSKFLLSLVNVRVKLISVFTNGKLLIVIDWDVDLFHAIGFIVWVMELGYIWMLQ